MHARYHFHNSCSWTFFAAFLLVASGSLAPGQEGSTTDPEAITAALTLSSTAMDHEHLGANKMGYMPTSFQLVPEKPNEISKVPRMKDPQYGSFRVGNGPRNITHFVVDESSRWRKGRLYIDRNQNGDLTDDGPGNWDEAKKLDGVYSYKSVVSVHVSWGTPEKETAGDSYSLFIYKRHGSSQGAYAKMSGREGELVIGDKTYSIMLAEYTNDGIFSVPVKDDKSRRFVQFCIDLDGDGTFKGLVSTVDGKEIKAPEKFDLADPVPIDDQWYIGRPTAAGDQLTLTPTDPPGDDGSSVKAPVKMKRLLAAGTPIPDFTVRSPDGKPISRGDFMGNVTIIDFWSTSCAPCLAAMPGLERVYQATKDQGVKVLSMNVFDTKERFDKWYGTNRSKYNFTFAFDPAESGSDASIASSKFHVPLLPTMYIISREGKVLATHVGAGQEKKLIEVLEEQGIKIDEK